MQMTTDFPLRMSPQSFLLTYKQAIWRNRTPAWVYAVALLPPFAIVGLSALQPWVPFYQLIGDPLALVESCLENATTLAAAKNCERPYFGILSNLGILLWCASAAVSLFTSLLIARGAYKIGPSIFLLYAGILTSALMMDDMFQGHEKVYPFFIGIDENIISGKYAVLSVIYLVIFRTYITKTDVPLLLLSLTLFALSVVMDQISLIEGLFVWDGVVHRVLEDGPKFLGIWAWAVFHIRAAWLMSESSGTESEHWLDGLRDQRYSGECHKAEEEL